MTEQSTREVHLVATLTAKPEQKAALFDALRSIIPTVRTEPGCIRYDLHEDLDNPLAAVMLETWRDQAALDAHAAAPAFQSLAAHFDTLLAEPIRLLRLERVD